MSETPDTRVPLEALDGHEFENVVERLLTKMGFSIHGRQAAADGGIDMVAVRDEVLTGGTYIIQCKRFSNPVAVSVVRDLYGVVQAERANKGILITTSRCTAAALEFVQGKPLEVVDGTRLHSLLHEHGIGADTPSTDHPRVPPGIQLAYAQLCKPLEAMIAESRRISGGLVFVQAQPLDTKRYAARLSKQFAQLHVTTGLLMSLVASLSDEMNRADPSAEDFAQLRLHIKEFLRTLNSLLDEQKRAYAIVPPDGFRDTHAAYRRIAPDLLGKFAVLSERLRAAVEGRLKRGEHPPLEITFDSLAVAEFNKAFANDRGRLQKRCFVATAAYGDPDDLRVVAFRNFRDRHLLRHPAGRRLVALYYMLSPRLAAVIAHASWARMLARALLAPAASLVIRLGQPTSED